MNTQDNCAHQDLNAVADKRRQTRLDGSQWGLLIEQQHRSGQSVRSFCLAHDLKEPTFYAWRVRLRERADQGSAALPGSQGLPALRPSHGFVRLVPTEVAAMTGDLVETHFPGGATLRCASHHLSQLVRLLQSDDRAGA